MMKTYKRPDEYNQLALHAATKAGNMEAVNLLAPFEAQIYDNNGKNALMYAVETNNLEAATKFLY